ncbi:DUF6916 family protein [Nitrospirillum sp. BR 11163]|uniref:DUF6916 family protein n=1 Tax=Nitrospirillum sp. BR 11163 TaxID=3104323 RepID=UPI002B002605|nr:hypothetical protein [Nitrospirillum sp. BR 11163]MEA1673339.1 hypothetical protein [Nitrospirillum sp. BR 11163]
MLGDLTAQNFLPLIDQEFTVTYPDYQETLILSKVDHGKKSAAPGRFRDPFSLLFNGTDRNTMLNQHIHPLTHPALGTLEIFLVPLGRNEDGTYFYQAVFS